MKSILLPYSKVIWFTVISHLIVSIILALLYNFDLFSTTIYQGSILILSLVITLIAGVILGAQVKKRALIHALVISCIWTLIALLFHQSFSIQLILKLLGKIVLFVGGSLIGRKIQMN